MLIIGRAVAGLGGSGLMNGGLTILSTCVPLQKRPRKMPRKNANALANMNSLVYLGVMMGSKSLRYKVVLGYF
jgi:MFS family permease